MNDRQIAREMKRFTAKKLWKNTTIADMKQQLQISHTTLYKWGKDYKWGPPFKSNVRPLPHDEFKAAAKAGMTRPEIAKHLGISVRSIDVLVKQHPSIKLVHGNLGKNICPDVRHMREGSYYTEDAREIVVAAMRKHKNAACVARHSGVGIAKIREWSAGAGIQGYGMLTDPYEVYEMRRLRQISIPFKKWGLTDELRSYILQNKIGEYESRVMCYE